MSPPLATVEIRRDAGGVIARLAGEIDLSNVDQVGAELERAREGAAALTVDLSAVDYLDSQAVRLLHELARAVRSAGSDLTLLVPPESIAGDVVRVTRLGEVARIEDPGAQRQPVGGDPGGLAPS
jgi:anti-anti-sigma factor